MSPDYKVLAGKHIHDEPSERNIFMNINRGGFSPRFAVCLKVYSEQPTEDCVQN